MEALKIPDCIDQDRLISYGDNGYRGVSCYWSGDEDHPAGSYRLEALNVDEPLYEAGHFYYDEMACQSLEETGKIAPVVVLYRPGHFFGSVIDGNADLIAARRLNYTHVPYIELTE